MGKQQLPFRILAHEGERLLKLEKHLGRRQSPEGLFVDRFTFWCPHPDRLSVLVYRFHEFKRCVSLHALIGPPGVVAGSTSWFNLSIGRRKLALDDMRAIGSARVVSPE